MKRVFHCVLWNILYIFHIVGWGSTASFFTVWALDWSASCVQGIERDLENGKARPSIQSWQNKTDKRGNSYSFRVLIIGNVNEKKEEREREKGGRRNQTEVLGWLEYALQFSHTFFFFLRKKRKVRAWRKIKMQESDENKLLSANNLQEDLCLLFVWIRINQSHGAWCWCKSGVKREEN